MNFSIKRFHHRNMDCIGVGLQKHDPRNYQLKKIIGIKWSRTHTCWYGEETSQLILAIEQTLGLIPAENQDAPKKVLDFSEYIEKLNLWMKSKRYSESTIKVYKTAIHTFLKFFTGKDPAMIGNDEIVFFNNEYLLKNNLSSSYQNQVVNALKLFYKVIENRELDISNVHRPRREHRLPNVLSKEQVKILLESCTNVKHKTMLSLVYALGLRRGELLALRCTDIDSGRNVVIIRQSKGKKDRIVPLSLKVLEMLRNYYTSYKPIEWLFEGQKPGEQYGERSIQMVLGRTAKKAGIKLPVTLHWLRHSYATHLHESGTDIRYIQELLGHSSSKTTEIYTHVSTRSLQNIRSPFDDL